MYELFMTVGPFLAAGVVGAIVALIMSYFDDWYCKKLAYTPYDSTYGDGR